MIKKLKDQILQQINHPLNQCSNRFSSFQITLNQENC